MRRWQVIFLTVVMVLAATTTVLGTELTLYWCCGQQDRADTWNAIALEFEAATGIKVNAVHPSGSGSYYDKVITAILGGSGPDVMWLGTGFWRLADGGLLMPLQDIIAKDATLKSIPSAIMAADYWMGNQLGVPYGLNINTIYYNKGMFATNGLKMPTSWTWDEMLNTATKLARDTDGDGNKDVWGFGFTNGDPLWWYSYGGNPYANGGKRMSINNGPNVESLRIMGDITTRGIVEPVWGGITYDPRNFFMGSKAAMTIDGPFSLPTYAAMDVDWDLGPFPDMKYNDKIIQLDMMTPESFSVNSYAKDPDAALALLKFVTNKESMMKYAKMGTIVPTVASAFPAFVTGDSKHNRKVFVDAIPHLGNYFYSHPAYSGSLNPIHSKYRTEVFMGRISAGTALEQMESEMNAALDEFWKNHK